MSEFNSIQTLYNNLKSVFDSSSEKNNISIIYSFNGVGKTRLSQEFIKLNENNEIDKIKVLCYNAFLEDYFYWDNENYILRISNSWITQLIIDQGLEKQIANNFKNILNTKIEPYFDLNNGEIIFNIPSGDDDSKSGIKISRGEESIFIWSVFNTILENIIDILNEKDTSNNMFDELKYVIIDDPVSSLDDTKLITLTINLIENIKSYQGKSKLNFLIMTHHSLFYNIFYNSFKNNNFFNSKTYILTKYNSKFKLEKIKDTPFSYHLSVLSEIKKAIDSMEIKKYHFNLFRSLLEKTSNFLGFSRWENCVVGDKKEEIIKCLNLNSHNRLSDFEYKELSDEQKDLFIMAFNNFIKEFKLKVE